MHQIFNEYYEAILALFDVGMTTSKLAGWAVSYLLHAKPKHASGKAASRAARNEGVSIPYCLQWRWMR